jgi:hypothetical protein
VPDGQRSIPESERPHPHHLRNIWPGQALSKGLNHQRVQHPVRPAAPIEAAEVWQDVNGVDRTLQRHRMKPAAQIQDRQSSSSMQEQRVESEFVHLARANHTLDPCLKDREKNAFAPAFKLSEIRYSYERFQGKTKDTMGITSQRQEPRYCPVNWASAGPRIPAAAAPAGAASASPPQLP